MQTVYSTHLPKAIKGMSLLRERQCRPLVLPWLAQVGTLVLTDTSEAGDLLLTLRDVQSGQEYPLTVAITTAVEATSLNEIVAAIQGDANWNARLTAVDDNLLTVTYTAKFANRVYEIDVDPPGLMVVTHTVTQVAGGAGLEFGQLVARGPGDREFRAMSGTTTVGQIAGMLFRTDANHFHNLENDSATDVDACMRGKYYAIAEEGEFWVEVQEAVTPASVPFARISGGVVGDWSATAGAGLLNVSTIARYTSSAGIGELASVKIFLL